MITVALVSHSSGYAAPETDMAYVSVKADMHSKCEHMSEKLTTHFTCYFVHL